jgi:hypothetical protein
MITWRAGNKEQFVVYNLDLELDMNILPARTNPSLERFLKGVLKGTFVLCGDFFLEVGDP